MASNRTVYHVVPSSDGSKWLVTIEDDDEFREEYDTKEKAVERTKVRARSQEPAQIKVHTSDGDVECESTYGQGP